MSAKLLIVDDEAIDLEQARRLLGSIDGLEILEAADGRKGLEVIEESSPDLVLSDIRMPELDGVELVRQCKERFPQLPVILMTSRGSERLATEALRAGAASYVPKADMPQHLEETVEAVLRVALARRQGRDIQQYFESSEMRFKLDNEPRLISALVAYLQEDLERCSFGDETRRSQVGTALGEALSNAMIHGNLEVSSDLRDGGSEPYHRLIAERRESSPWRERVVRCHVERDRERVRYVIQDEGPGFDPSSLPDPTQPEGMLKARGRGLFLIHAFMDRVEHNDLGNKIRMTKFG